MQYKIERGGRVDADIEAIFDFLYLSYVKFGDEREDAYSHASERIGALERALTSLGRLPHQGTRLDRIMAGMRSVTKDRAIFYFRVDDKARVVRVLAVFFGGQDHPQAMLRRLLGED